MKTVDISTINTIALPVKGGRTYGPLDVEILGYRAKGLLVTTGHPYLFRQIVSLTEQRDGLKIDIDPKLTTMSTEHLSEQPPEESGDCTALLDRHTGDQGWGIKSSL
jgi:hypothetical protein